MLAIHSSCAEIWQWAIKRKDSIKIIKALCWGTEQVENGIKILVPQMRQ
jgi:hypothetical protein